MTDLDKLDFDALTPAQRRVAGLIAINEDTGHDRRVLASLVSRGIIDEYNERWPGHPPMTVKRYMMPLHVHMRWCSWCAQRPENDE